MGKPQGGMGKKDVIRVILVDDIPEAREGLRKLLAFEPDIEVVGSGSTGREGLDLAIRTQPDIILMDINMPDMDGINATEQISKAVPTAAVVMMSVHKDSAYLRRAMLAGARDFLEKPISGEELYSTIRKVYQLNANVREQYRQGATSASPERTKATTSGALGSKRAGHIIAVYSPQGGVGKTTLATNVAAGLMREDTRVLLIDCDLEFGDLAVFLYLQSNLSVVDLGKAVEELDPDLIENVLMTHASGLRVLLGPARLDDVDETNLLTPEVFEQIVQHLAANFDFTILDMRVRLDRLAARLFNLADRILLVGTPTLPTVKSCRQVLEVLDGEFGPEKTIFVMNRVTDPREKIGLPLEDIERSLKRQIEARIPLDEKTMTSAVNQGVPVVAKGRGKSPAKEIIDLAELVRRSVQGDESTPMQSSAAGKQERSRFGRRSGG
ncbi:MAG: response regulator [Chloroflexi bacterium]|nr:response regulator [Chloroflexota bacterium]